MLPVTLKRKKRRRTYTNIPKVIYGPPQMFMPQSFIYQKPKEELSINKKDKEMRNQKEEDSQAEKEL